MLTHLLPIRSNYSFIPQLEQWPQSHLCYSDIMHMCIFPTRFQFCGSKVCAQFMCLSIHNQQSTLHTTGIHLIYSEFSSMGCSKSSPYEGGGKIGIPELKITAASKSELIVQALPLHSPSHLRSKSLQISFNEKIKTTKRKL